MHWPERSRTQLVPLLLQGGLGGLVGGSGRQYALRVDLDLRCDKRPQPIQALLACLLLSLLLLVMLLWGTKVWQASRP